MIEKLFVDVDQVVMPGQVLAELDRENLTAREHRYRPRFSTMPHGRPTSICC